MKNKDIIHGIIHECVTANASFTVFDVLTEGKKRKCRSDQYEVDDIMKSAYYPIYYRLSSLVIKGKVVEIFHPENKLPEKYDAKPILKYIKKTIKTAPKKRRTVAEKEKQRDKILSDIAHGVISAEYYLPMKVVRGSGFLPWEKAKVDLKDNHIEITKYKSITQKRWERGVVTVDKHGNIKLKTHIIANHFYSNEIVDIVAKPGNIRIYINT